MPSRPFRIDGQPSPANVLPAIGEHTAESLSRTHIKDIQ
jgi:hypothetical protein